MAIKKILPSDQPMREIRPVRMAYADIFPPCATDNCYEIADTQSAFCDRCSSNREWEARLAARRQARER